MIKYAAFLRGVNVGGRIVKMADLKKCLEKAGLKEVVTLLQSGNVVFKSDRDPGELKSLIEASLSATFGYRAKAQVVSLDKLSGIVEKYPFGIASESQHDYIIFVEDGLEKDMTDETYQLSPNEEVRAGEGVVYWRVDKGSTLKSSFAKVLTKSKYRDLNTNRNLRTVKKMLAI